MAAFASSSKDDGREPRTHAPAAGDAVALDVRWPSDLGAWEGKPVRLRFELKDATLFAFQFLPT